jgi:hypothetical protein
MPPFVAPPHAVPPCAVVVPPLTLPPLAVVVPPLAVVVPPLAVPPLAVPPAPLLSHHRLSCRTVPLLCWLVVALPRLSLLQRLSCAGWLLNCHLSCRIATSLVAPLPLSSHCLSIFMLSLSYCTAPLNDGIAFDNRRRDEQDVSARLVRNTLSKCWDGMKGRHYSSTEGGMGRRVTSMNALTLNNFLSCRLLSCRPTQCRLVPLSCRPSPCHPLPLLCHPLPLSRPPLPCHPLPYHPPLSCHATVSHVTLLLSCAGWLLHCLVSRCSNVSLVPAGC